MKHTILTLAAFAGMTVGLAEAQTTDTIYRCTMQGHAPLILNLTRHRFELSGTSGVLNGGIWFNLTTPAGYYIQMDLGDQDHLFFQKPARVTGKVIIEKDGRTRLSGILCERA